MIQQINHTIIGLPASGKTTFLAALWHLIEADEINTRLKLAKFEGNREYINQITKLWRSCEKVPRNSGPAEMNISIWVNETGTGHQAKLNFPDLSGESFDLQISTRQCRDTYFESLNGNGGIMLFVTADRRQDDLTHSHLPMFSQADADNGVSKNNESEHEGNAKSLKDWKHDDIPKQVKLVELLQFIQRPPFPRSRRRLAVMVSAWDVLDDSDFAQDPRQWLKLNMALLDQFLENNSDCFEVRVYGVSAQGGDLDASKEKLLQKQPSQRVICVGDDVLEHDLTAPIHWLMTDL